MCATHSTATPSTGRLRVPGKSGEGAYGNPYTTHCLGCRWCNGNSWSLGLPCSTQCPGRTGH